MRLNTLLLATQPTLPTWTNTQPSCIRSVSSLHMEHKQTDAPVFGVDRRVHQKTTGLANQSHSENGQHTTTPGS